MRKNKKKKMKYKISLLILAILIIVVIILIGTKLFKKEDDAPVKVVDSIDNFGYTLDERDTKLMKDTYKELKEVLKSGLVIAVLSTTKFDIPYQDWSAGFPLLGSPWKPVQK